MIEHAIIISLIVLAWVSFTWEGMIFEGIKKIIKPEWSISKPAYGCPICACVWWGSLLYYLFFRLSWIDWFLTIGTATGMSVIFVILIAIREYCISRTRKEEEPCC